MASDQRNTNDGTIGYQGVVPLIVVAYATAPIPNSPEGIVNAHWIDILKQNTQVYLVTSPYGYVEQKTALNPHQSWIDKLLILTEKSLSGQYGNVVRWIVKVLSRLYGGGYIHHTFWERLAVKRLKKYLGNHKEVLVWVRVLPTISLSPVMKTYQEIGSFPLVINFNDPIPRSLLFHQNFDAMDKVEKEEISLIKKAVNLAQYYTFPSEGLLDLMSAFYSLPKERCVVIPHAMPTPSEKEEKTLTKTSLPYTVLYAGTFYNAAFTDTVGGALRRFTDRHQEIQFVFLLKNRSHESEKWLAKYCPDAEIYYGLKHEECRSFYSQARAFIIIEALHFAPLMLTKVAESISFSKPILAIVAQNAHTARLLGDVGIVANCQDDESIYNGLIQLLDCVSSQEKYRWTSDKMAQIADQLSDKNIWSTSRSVIDRAINYFKLHNQ
jgi:hypothetical protein